MAQKHPGSLTPPYSLSDFRGTDGRFDVKAELEAEKQWFEQVREDLRSNAKGDLVGEEVRFPRGDGCARYLVAKQRPFTLVHLKLGDAWHADEATIRGYRLQDARAQVEANRRWKVQTEAREKATKDFYEGNLGKMVHYHDGFGQFIRCEVVRAEHDGQTYSGVKKGELCLKQTALVGNWRNHDLDSDSTRVEGCRDNHLFRPNLSNVYEYAEDLQSNFSDPRGAEPCVVLG